MKLGRIELRWRPRMAWWGFFRSLDYRSPYLWTMCLGPLQIWRRS